MVQSQDFIVKGVSLKRVHVSTEHGSANQPRHTNPTNTGSPSPQCRLSVNSSSGIHRGLNSLPAFTPLSLQPKTPTVRVPHLPLNFRSVWGSRMRICSSLDMFWPLRGRLVPERSCCLALSHWASAARERAARSLNTRTRAGLSDRVRFFYEVNSIYYVFIGR